MHEAKEGFDRRPRHVGLVRRLNAGTARGRSATTTSPCPTSSSVTDFQSRCWTGTSRPPAPRVYDIALGGELLGASARRTARPRNRVSDGLPTGRARCVCSATPTASTRGPDALLDVVAHRKRLRDPSRATAGSSGCRAGARCGTGQRRRDPAPAAPGSRSIAPTCDDPSREPRADHRRRHRLGCPRHRGVAARPARERRARGAPRRHRHVGALRRPPPLRRLSPRSRRLRRRLPGRDPRGRRARGRGLRPAAVVVRPRGPRRPPRRLPGAGARLSPDTIFRSNDKAETYAFLHRLGLPAPAFRRVNGAAEVEAAAHELGYPEVPGLLQARVLLGLARLPHPRSDGRPRPPAAATSARARSRCASRRRSSCFPPRVGRTCS